MKSPSSKLNRLVPQRKRLVSSRGQKIRTSSHSVVSWGFRCRCALCEYGVKTLWVNATILFDKNRIVDSFDQEEVRYTRSSISERMREASTLGLERCMEMSALLVRRLYKAFQKLLSELLSHLLEQYTSGGKNSITIKIFSVTFFLIH